MEAAQTPSSGSYVVLARRYRPQRFADLVGQEHVSLTLKNALKLGRIAHAYLFTGPRGVGKTSAARILAKALRCLTPAEDFEPCNNCASCQSINSGTSLDVIEIDAASNTGVDNIRDLRENVGYMASTGKYRIYIIDEVHMLSTAAFNALLKTLEEPPPHVIFIFATTELHKVLPTIVSRCQRFDFKRIAPEVITDNLKFICTEEKVTIDDASLRTIVFESEGCLRDAQSLLDRSIALCGSEVRIEVLEKALGLVDRASFFELLKLIGRHDTGGTLKLCSGILGKGIDPKILLNRTTEFFRDLHFFHFTGESPLNDEAWLGTLEVLSEALSSDEIVRAFDLCLRSQGTLGSSFSPAMLVESLVVKLALQRPTAGGEAAEAPRTERPAAAAPAARPASPASAPASAPAAPAPSSDSPQKQFEAFITRNKPAWTPVLKSILSLEVSGPPDNRLVQALAKNDFAGKRLASVDGLEILKRALSVARADVKLEGPNAAQPQISHQQKVIEKKQQAREHDAVTTAMKLFDAVITETKILEDDGGNK